MENHPVVTFFNFKLTYFLTRILNAKKIAITLRYNKQHYQKGFMGAQCVKSSPKQNMNSHLRRMDSKQLDLQNCAENLRFTMTIGHLRLTNMTDKVKQVKFSLEKQFEITYCLSEFTIQENLIKSEKKHKTQFEFLAKRLDSKRVKIEIINFNDQVIESLSLKLTHLCSGPVHHDHLLPELKARLMFDLHLYQNISLSAECKDLKITLFQENHILLENLSYKFVLTVILYITQTQIDEKIFSSKQVDLKNQQNLNNPNIFVSIPNNILKDSNFRFDFLKAQQKDIPYDENSKVIHSIFIPYRKVQNYQTFSSSRKKQIDYTKKTILFVEPLKHDQKVVGKVQFTFQVESSILYVQQMECLIFSEIGVSSVSPTVSCSSNEGLIKQIKQIYKSVKKIKSSIPEQKSELIKNIEQIYRKFQMSNQEIFTSQEELYERQMTLVKLLNELSSFFSEGQDILNERLWRTIDYIVHKPELSIRYLTLHQNQNTKKEVYLRYYKFIIVVLQKVIVSTGTGITFHELQCIQKFVAFSYFRFPWIQDKILIALKRNSDPIISEEKLIEFGANRGCRSPSKSYVYDWEVNVYRKIQNQKEFKQMMSKLQTVSSNYEQWDELIFNRKDQDLFYGLYLQIWNQAEITLKNLRGKILWEYFPNYGQLLSCFLGQMNDSKISDYSTMFKQCSKKLMLNQRLLNTFVIQLFPKTYLFEISCVLKCLNLLESYFQVLTKQNKKLPHDFHFNFFYTGIKSIFQQNHSYLVVKALFILYKFYDIFTLQFRKTINSFILSNIFYSLFLHWCTNVRQMFHHLIYYKILYKKVTNPEQSCNQLYKVNRLNKPKQTCFSQELLFNRKLNTFLRAIKSYCDQSAKQILHQKKSANQTYHQRMKEKLQQKKIKKSIQNQQLSYLSLSKISQDGKASSFMIRKQSLNAQNIDFQSYKIRKMSVADQFYCEKVDQKYKQYCSVSLKQYNQVKNLLSSPLQVQKLAKLVQGDIDS